MAEQQHTFIHSYSSEGLDSQNTNEVRKLSKIVDKIKTMATQIQSVSQLKLHDSKKSARQKNRTQLFNCSGAVLPQVMSSPSLDFKTYDLQAHIEPEEGVKDLLMQRKVKKELKMGMAANKALQPSSSQRGGILLNQSSVMTSRRRIQLPEKTFSTEDNDHFQAETTSATAGASEYKAPSVTVEQKFPKIDSLEKTTAEPVDNKQKPQVRMLQRHWQSNLMKHMDERKDQYATMASEFGRYVQGFETVCKEEQKETPVKLPMKLFKNGSRRFTIKDSRLPKLKASQRYESNRDIEPSSTKSQGRCLVLRDSTLTSLNAQPLPPLKTTRNKKE